MVMLMTDFEGTREWNSPDANVNVNVNVLVLNSSMLSAGLNCHLQ